MMIMVLMMVMAGCEQGHGSGRADEESAKDDRRLARVRAVRG